VSGEGQDAGREETRSRDTGQGDAGRGDSRRFDTGSILLAATPSAWVDAAVAGWQELLVDHANCEKKAASTAVALIFAYPEDTELGLALSRLAREELRHFEQVQSAMTDLGVSFIRQKPGRYAAGLRRELRTSEPGRKLDLLLSGALIEARSCERFRLLAERLPAPLGRFYGRLAESEARHFELYVGLARQRAPQEWEARLGVLARTEAELATAPDGELRFHSGPPG
jgi:tRNA 2-(methylsulfanyl)-N6-isopentenyladenosine37 hydroxylase